MSVKQKFQISRTLDERIKRIFEGSVECGIDCSLVTTAYILGFSYGFVTNYVGLTTDYKSCHTLLDVLGVVFFETSPSTSNIKRILEEVKENSHFLIYNKVEEDLKQVVKKIYDYSSENFLLEQPKLSVLDEAKIYAHSALSKVKASVKLDICNTYKKLLSEDEIVQHLNQVKESFANVSKAIKIHLNKSNFSTSISNKSSDLQTEILYDHLDVPDEVAGLGDYLPETSKAEKGKLAEKWRNKVKAQRAPLELSLEHDELSCEGQETLPTSIYILNLELYLHLHMSDTLTKSLTNILHLIRNCLSLAQIELVAQTGSAIEADDLKVCTFFSSSVGHLMYSCYLLPTIKSANYKRLFNNRHQLHSTFLVSMEQPRFRYSQRLTCLDLSESDRETGYLCNVHSCIAENSGIKGGLRSIIRGKYTYHHYSQDRTNDNGWGCAYRSLQTIISWFKYQGYIYSPDIEMRWKENDKEDNEMTAIRKKLNQESRVPNHEEIQRVLVDLGDKQVSFIKSRNWIGSQEVCYVLNHLYNIDSKFISINSGSELVYKVRDLSQHFAQQSTPIMIGGGVLAHTIIGIDFNEKNGDVSYLILDPHYTGNEDLATITKKGWCGWKKNNFWDKNAFYNLCLPQRPNEI